jgi:hypothetical protein
VEKQLNFPRKQKYTATAIFHVLVEEDNFQGSPRSIRRIVSELRKEREQMKKRPQGYLDADISYGEELQIDHGEVTIEIGGEEYIVYWLCCIIAL